MSHRPPPVTLEAADPDNPGALAMAGAPTPDGVEPMPELQDVLVERTVLGAQGCQQKVDLEEVKFCHFGDHDSEVTILLAGGSHSTHWYPALEPLMEEHGWHVQTALKSSCLFTADPEALGLDASCRGWNEALMAHIAAEPPDLVVTTATRGEGADEHVPEGYLTWWHDLEEQDVPVLAIRDTPRGRVDRPECLEIHGVDTTACDLPRDDALSPTDPTTELSDPPTTVTFLDLTEYFCDSEVCPPVIGNVVVYIDAHHLTAAYASTLAPVLEPPLLELLGSHTEDSPTPAGTGAGPSDGLS